MNFSAPWTLVLGGAAPPAPPR